MSLTDKQIEYLLRPIHPQRVLRDNKGMSHVSQQDIRAHLTRVFGFGGWSSDILDLTCVAERQEEGRKGWFVTYRATVRLTVRDPEGNTVASYDDVGTGTSPNLPTLGDGHDFASKVAVSMALKRCATNLGDGFGLSLYNKGQTAPLVIFTLVTPDPKIVDELPEQVDMGHDDAGSSTLNTAQDSPPAPPVEPSPASGDAPASDSLPEAGATLDPSVSEKAVAQQVEKIRDRVHEAMTIRSNQDALMKLTRVSLDAGKAGLMAQMTTMPTGEPVTVAVLLDNATKIKSRTT